MLAVSMLNQNSFAQMTVIDTFALNQRSTRDMREMAEFAKEIVQTTATASNTAQTVVSLTRQLESMTGNLGLNRVLETSFNQYLTNYENLVDPLPSRRVGGMLLDNKNSKDVYKLLVQEVYSTRNDPNQDTYHPLMRKYHTDSVQSALQLSQTVISNAEERLEEINQAARESDNNLKLKEAVDVTNHLLVQLLVTQNETNQLLAQLTRATLSKDFRGTYQSAEKEEKSVLEKIKGSTKNTSNEVFKIKDKDIPFKRGKASPVSDKFFK